MNLKNYENMDVNILLSIVNMKLRDEFSNFEDLIKYYDIDPEKFTEILKIAGYVYNEDINQFH